MWKIVILKAVERKIFYKCCVKFFSSFNSFCWIDCWLIMCICVYIATDAWNRKGIGCHILLTWGNWRASENVFTTISYNGMNAAANMLFFYGSSGYYTTSAIFGIDKGKLILTLIKTYTQFKPVKLFWGKSDCKNIINTGKLKTRYQWNPIDHKRKIVITSKFSAVIRMRFSAFSSSKGIWIQYYTPK